MAELLGTALRGPHCSTMAAVSGSDDVEKSWLLCDLKPDHDGPLHYDATDHIWWAKGGEPDA